MKLKGVLAVLVVAAAGAAFWPAAGGAATFRGIVVAKQHGTLLVSSTSGVVRAASGRAAVGSRVVVTGRTAAVVGRARSAVIRGIVVRRVGTTMFLSSNRHLLAIHNARRLADTAPTPTAPQPGAIVSAQVSLANGELVEQNGAQLLTTPMPRRCGKQETATKNAPDNGNRPVRVNQQSDTATLPELQTRGFKGRRDGNVSLCRLP